MKKIIILSLFISTSTICFSQNVGIGTTTPVARLHVKDSNVVFSAPGFPLTVTPGSPPLNGAGSRMMWYADKAAFRVGTVTDDRWDKDNVGPFSFAAGFNTRAVGEGAFAGGAYSAADGDNSVAMGGGNASGVNSIGLGANAFAYGNYSLALGYNANVTSFAAFATAIGPLTTASGPYSTVVGHEATAAGSFSLSLGYRTIATNGATAIGYETNAAGFYSTAMGDSTIAYGISSIAVGHKARAYADFSVAFGNNTKAKATNSFVVGAFNDTTATNRIFEIGKGTADNLRSNAMTVLTNGNVGIGDNNPITKLSVAGSGLINGSLTVGSLSGFPYTLDVFGTGMFRGSNYLSLINSSGTEDTYIRGGKSSSKVFINDIANMGPVITASNVGIGNTNPLRPLSFSASLGEKILLYPGGTGEVGIGVYGNELRLHCDNPGSMVSFGTQDNAGVFTQAGRFQLTGGYGLYVNGNIWANGTTYASDERFKQNITAIKNPLQKLMLLNGVEYEMKVTDFKQNNFQSQRQIGLLAQ
ncbi:MAG: tail fiber domain-containing protein, partial [Chitinophagaceae bacterium]|nr:tail fiber domain-containing protein [Chitinophagaceae bacterium]